MGYSGKNQHCHDGRHTGKSHGNGVNGFGNLDGSRVLNQKIHPQD